MVKYDKRLGEFLIEERVITQEQLDHALKEQKKTKERLGVVLVKLGFATEEAVLHALSKKIGVSHVRLKDVDIRPEVIEKVPAKFACYYKLIPIKFDANILTIAITNPLDLGMLDDVKLVLGCELDPVLSSERDIMEAIRKYYGVGAETVEKIMGQTNAKAATAPQAGTTTDIEEMADDASIIKFVNQVMQQAVAEGATDVHFEPFEDELRIRYRTDGILFNAPIPPNIKYLHASIVSRIKIMAALNIAERRLPQDGRIKLKVGNYELDLRVSVIPTSYGESVHIRLLTANILMGMESLGLLENDLVLMENLIRKPHGIIFVTGPTGSGKTTTLYAALSKINDSKKNIITIEDPIEYQLRGVTQIQINPKIGLTFAGGLRAMLRHDPDIMMVGEVRDLETAEIAIRVALTGHLVFSTLHTNDAAGAITRLLDMGIEPYLVSSSIEAILAQRLVRMICPQCKVPISLEPHLLEELKIEEADKNKFFEGKGCPACKFTGYKGRTAIYEILVMNDTIREMVLKGVSAIEIQERALKEGMRTLFQDGMVKVKRGLTSIKEVLRVTEMEDSIQE